MAGEVLVPLDGSPQSWEALEAAIDLHPTARITLLTVINPIEAGSSHRTVVPGSADGWFDAEQAAAKERFQEAEKKIPSDRALETAVRVGRPSRVIVEFAEETGIDAIVIGSHGRSGISRILLGSVAEKVLRRSPVPVTVVR